jgi:hypothetical protein
MPYFRPWDRWENNIKTVLKIEYDGVKELGFLIISFSSWLL